MSSILDEIPGVSDLMDRWFSADDAGGITFEKRKYLTLDSTCEVLLPVTISVTMTRNKKPARPGLNQPVSQDDGSTRKSIVIKGKAGNWRNSMLPPLPAIPMVGGAVSGVAGVVGTLLGTEELVNKGKMLRGLYRTFLEREPIKIEDDEGLLYELGIEEAVPKSLTVNPSPGGDANASWTLVLETTGEDPEAEEEE